jgi:hypothetical protein
VLHPQRSPRYVALSRSPGGPAGSATRRERRILWELLRSIDSVFISLSNSRAPSSTEKRTGQRASGANSEPNQALQQTAATIRVSLGRRSQRTVSRHWASPRGSAEFPTSVREVLTMLGKSHASDTAGGHRTGEGPWDRRRPPDDKPAHARLGCTSRPGTWHER